MPEAMRTTTPNIVTCDVWAAEESRIVVAPSATDDRRVTVRVTTYEGIATDALVTLTRDQLASLVAQARALLGEVAA